MTAGNTHQRRGTSRDPSVTRDQGGRSVRDADRRQREQYEAEADVDVPVSRESLAPVIGKVRDRGQSARVIAGTMLFASMFALLGDELAGVTSPKKGGSGVRIIVGGLTGTVLLLVLNEAGDPGSTLAEGLAVVTLVSVVLVKGGPVWSWANRVFGSSPTSPSGATSGTPYPLRQPVTNPQQLAQASTVHPPVARPTIPTGGPHP